MRRPASPEPSPTQPASLAEASIPWSTAAALARAAAREPAAALGRFETQLTHSLDPGARRQRGVHYTPAPLARFVVRCAHELVEGLGIPGGLLAERVRLLDPAAGTGRFLGEALRLAVDVDPSRDRAALLARWVALDLDPGGELLNLELTSWH